MAGAEFTVIETVFEFAVPEVVQVAFEVSTTEILSPLESVLEVNVLELPPALAPFTCH